MRYIYVNVAILFTLSRIYTFPTSHLFGWLLPRRQDINSGKDVKNVNTCTLLVGI